MTDLLMKKKFVSVQNGDIDEKIRDAVEKQNEKILSQVTHPTKTATKAAEKTDSSSK